MGPEAPVLCTTPGDCDDQNPCTADSCDPASGMCVHLPNSIPCDDGDPCTKGDLCADGACKPGALLDCDDGNPCTKDVCSTYIPGGCGHVPLGGIPCDDGNPCTQDDLCDLGQCKGKLIPCNDKNPCTDDFCDPALGCTSKPNQEPCDDNDMCTGGDACASGQCKGTPVTCDDANPCTADSCDPAKGCVFATAPGVCDDGDPCTGPDLCEAGTCVSGPHTAGCCKADPDCDDQDPCTVEECAAKKCVRLGEPEGTPGGTGCATGSGCAWSVCDAADGKCRAIDLSMPTLLHAWDFGGGKTPAGFAWTKPGGTISPNGLLAPADAGTAFSLPSHFAPAGVKVLYLWTGDCAKVSVLANGKAPAEVGCNETDGVAASAWIDGVVKKTDVQVTVKNGGAVTRLALHAWAGPDCKPVRPRLLAPGAAYTDLALDNDWTAAMVGFRAQDDCGAVALDFLAGPGNPSSFMAEPAELKGFPASVLSLPDGRFLVAHAEASNRIGVTLTDRTGAKKASTVPELLGPGEGQADPFLAAVPGGPTWLAWTSIKAGSGVPGIAMAEVEVAGDEVYVTGSAVTLGGSSPGGGHGPVLAFGDGLGLAAWIFDSTAGNLHGVHLRMVSPAGVPDEVHGEKAGTADGKLVYSHLAIARTTGPEKRFFLGWQTAESFPGGFVSLGVAGVMVDLDLNVTPIWLPTKMYEDRWTSPLLAGLPDGAILVYLEGQGTEAKLVQRRIGLDGVATSSKALIPLTTFTAEDAYLAIGRPGPFMVPFAYRTGVAKPQGIYLGLTGGACINGPVYCMDPQNPAVCIGFGKGMPNGYMKLPGVSWCE